MKITIKQILFFTTILALSKNTFLAQVNKTLSFYGLNPSVTIEPFYEKGELDVNILPFVYQRTLTERFDIRLNSIINLGIRNEGNEISHFGFELGLPIFLKRKEDKIEISNGLFIAPIVSLTRNRLEEHNNFGLWVEPGYNLLFDNGFAMTFGFQFGGTYFAYDNGKTNFGSHLGVKIIIGKWL